MALIKKILIYVCLVFLLIACQGNQIKVNSANGGNSIKVLAAETYLADIAQAVAGNRAKVKSLMPLGVDPHSFEPSPQDVIEIANSQVFITVGGGYESWLNKTLNNAGGQRLIIESSKGLTYRTPRPRETNDQADPHFWLNPINGIKFVENIRDGLIQADPPGKDIYTKNASDYIRKLDELDRWIAQQTTTIPPAKRLLVTNHESLGYFADRYGFTIIGTIIPGISTEASPSAQQLAQLADQIRATHAHAVFLEVGTNLQLANQLTQETGVIVIANLYTETLSPADGPAADYISMLKTDTALIVDALK